MTLRMLFAVALLVASPLSAMSQDLSGTVHDASGTAIHGARVLIVELDRAVTGAADGAFRFERLPAGRYTLDVRRPGYQPAIVDAHVPAAAPVTIVLQLAPIPLEPLTTTVTRGPLASARSPLPVDAVGREALQRQQSISLAHTLERLPGVRTLSTGLEIGKPVIRGLSGARVLVLSQGMRLEDYSWSDEDAPAVDAAAADRVELVRGPASVLFGPDAVGGVVNVIPLPLPEAVEGQALRHGEIEVGVHSNNREGDLILRGDGATGPWGWRAMLAARGAEALHTPAGELENTGFAALTGEAAVARRGTWGSLTARYVRYGGEFKLLEEDGPPAGTPEPQEEAGPERKLSDDRLQLLGNFPLGGLRLETRVQAQRHGLIELEDDPQARQEGRFVEVEIFNLALWTGYAEALLHHSLLPRTEGTFGFSGKLQHSTSSGVVPLIPDADVTSGGVFLLEQLEAGPFTLLAGGRGDIESVSADEQAKRAFSAWNGSIGASWQAPLGLTLSANIGTAWRAPTLFELYAEGPRLGEARYEIGDPNLEEERALDLDAGVRFQRGPARASVSLFRNSFDGFLYIQPTDRTQDGYRVFEHRQAEATLEGAEASLELEPLDWLALHANGELVRGTNEAADESLPLIPPQRARLGAEVHGATAFASLAYAGAEVQLVAEPDRLNPFDLAVGGYTLLDLTAGIERSWGRRPLRLDLGVHNALNRSYRDFLSRYKAFALNPGRDIALRLSVGL